MTASSSDPAGSAPRAHPSLRDTLSLDGQWELAESLAAADVPTSFPRRVPVPGLANLAQPPLPQIDEFESYELNHMRIHRGEIAEADRIPVPGVSRQPRNYLWYRTTFRAPARREVATLIVAKAQFGTAAWLNGHALGEHAGCFTAGRFDLSSAIAWEQDNELLVRIGAHPAVLPAGFPAGTDFEKLRWTPGIYDRVSVVCCDSPAIESVQVAPRLASSSILVETRVKNRGTSPRTFTLVHRAAEWRSGRLVATARGETCTLPPGGERVVATTLAMPAARLWSPEDPFLYTLETDTGADAVRTRFGLREFRSEAASGRFFLNGQPCWLRGSNIALHRFFEDPACGALPWDDAWVRRLLDEIPRGMHWNAFRFTIGPVPDRWLEIADECGLLIQNEFFTWTGHPKWRPNYERSWDADELVRQFSDWQRDNWNHPSIVIWDACNETFDPVFGEKVIPAVRALDLSGRPWDNGYNPPVVPDDPAEIHPYFYASSHWNNRPEFQLAELETKTFEDVVKLGSADPLSQPHPLIINEYGWLWLNRDGSPTELTKRVYAQLLGPDATADERFALYAYTIAVETEFFRATRRFAGLLHFVYLTCSFPGAFTSDPFRDVRALELEPHFAGYFAEVFKPLGICLNFYQPTLTAGTERRFTVILVNDTARAESVDVTLFLESGSAEPLGESRCSLELAAFGSATGELTLRLPDCEGACLLKAGAQTRGRDVSPSLSRRRVTLVR